MLILASIAVILGAFTLGVALRRDMGVLVAFLCLMVAAALFGAMLGHGGARVAICGTPLHPSELARLPGGGC